MIRLQNIFYTVPDVEQVAAFYRDAFGMAVKFQDGERWVQFNLDGRNFAIGAPSEAPEGAVGATAVLEVEDIDGLRETIVSHGGRILSERDMGSHGRTLAFADPAGNILQLFQRSPGG
ncbi:MAG: hypothetical protein DI528_15715 [Shinella sp.]|nr:MAG: hypothetical protein DI528_15715 [Shinella sp.]